MFEKIKKIFKIEHKKTSQKKDVKKATTVASRRIGRVLVRLSER